MAKLIGYDKRATSDLDRLLKHVPERPTKEELCWIWEAAFTKGGYGKAWLSGKSITAHRAVWLASGNSLTEGMHLAHQCHTRACVRPSHMLEQTPTENLSDNKFARRTHCTGGHLYDDANTAYVIKNGRPYRRCRICTAEKAKARALRM